MEGRSLETIAALSLLATIASIAAKGTSFKLLSPIDKRVGSK